MLPMAAIRVGSMSHWKPAAEASSYTLRVTCHHSRSNECLCVSMEIVKLVWFGISILIIYLDFFFIFTVRDTQQGGPPIFTLFFHASVAGVTRGVLSQERDGMSSRSLLSWHAASDLDLFLVLRASFAYLGRVFPLMWLRGRGLRQQSEPLSRGLRGLLTSLGLSWPRLWPGWHASLKGQT